MLISCAVTVSVSFFANGPKSSFSRDDARITAHFTCYDILVLGLSWILQSGGDVTTWQ